MLIIHCKEDVQEHYLEQYRNLALQGKISWQAPERIGTSLSHMFKHDGYRFMKKLHSEWQQNLNKESKGYFELKCLYLILRANPSMSVEFYPTSRFSATQEARTDFLKEIVSYMKDRGIAADRISIGPEQTIMEQHYRAYAPLIAYKLRLREE